MPRLSSIVYFKILKLNKESDPFSCLIMHLRVYLITNMKHCITIYKAWYRPK